MDFEDDWVRIRRPFVPRNELPAPEFGTDTYSIVIAPSESDEIDEPVLYDDGTTSQLSTLVETPPSPPTDQATASDSPETALADDPDAAIAAFASEHLVEDDNAVTTTSEVYEAYTDWSNARDLPVESKSWFARRLGEQVSFERTTKRHNGTTVRCYEGVTLQEDSSDERE